MINDDTQSSAILPDAAGRYGSFGGCYLPEALMAPIQALQEAYVSARRDPEFKHAYLALLRHYAGRPTPLTSIDRFSAQVGAPRILLKREDLLHTGAHKINNVVGQCLLAQRMKKTRIIAETGAGQHGVATATVCARLGLECVIYMGAHDIERQAPNVERMRLLGATIQPVAQGAGTLKDAVNEALRDWSASYDQTHYCLGSALGPHPYPALVAWFQSIIGKETVETLQRDYDEQWPDEVVACVGGGSNAIGMFSAFIEHPSVRLVGVEAGGSSLAFGQHAARFSAPQAGILHGCLSYVLQNEDGQVAPTHSISAGLDYPMVGPQLAALYDAQRVHFAAVEDQAALRAFQCLAEYEGIIPALESSHALAYVMQQAASGFYKKNKINLIVVNLSGRGDKDLQHVLSQLSM